MGVQIATRPTWAFQDVPPKTTAFWRKQPRSPGRAGWQASPSFSYKYGKEGRTKKFNPPGIWHSLKIRKKNCFREENPCRGASVTFPWVISRRFSTVLHRSSSVLQSSTGKYLKPSFSIHSMYPWWSTFRFMYFYSRFHLLFIPPFDVLKPFI